MSRLIDVDALMPKLKFIREAEHQIYGKRPWGVASKCITAVEDTPTIEERKKGKWIKREIGWKCSNCTLCTNDRGADSFNYCPNCGADMRGIPDDQS